MSLIKRTSKYIREDIWKIPMRKLPKKKYFLIKQLKIILLTIRGFDEDKCSLRASAMTFYSALSIVPVIAMLFAIAKGFGFQTMLETQLQKSFEGQQEVLNWVMSFAHSLLDSTKGGLIAGIGVVILFWSVMKLLGNIEKSFNDIWEIKNSRPFIRKFTDYMAIVIIAPIFIVLSSSATVFISTYIKSANASSEIINYVTPLLSFLVKLLPYVLIILLLTFLYLVMPNTKVSFKSAFFAGLIAGILFQLAQWGYVNFQVGVSRYNAIYGSFAALPLFLIWLQLSWLIVLFGAELAFATQYVDRYEYEVDISEVSYYQRITLAILVASLIIKTFRDGKPPMNSNEIADYYGMPKRLINNIIYDLIKANLITEVKTKNPSVFAYQPAEDINKLSLGYVINKLEDYGNNEIIVNPSEEHNIICSKIKELRKLIEKSEHNILLKDL
ncbi:MAG: YihY/virulence factor BrkB family protein [Marinilabiliales bacterium]